MQLTPGVTAHTTDTARLQMHWFGSGPEDGELVVLVHGNLSTGRFFEHLMPLVPDGYRVIAPDMRGFGRSEPRPIDATRGLRDWSDDVRSLLEALGLAGRPAHLLGWSTGGAAIGSYALDHGDVASLTYVDPVSPYGFGGVRADGTACFEDWAGSGGGVGSPDFAAAVRDGDRGVDSPFSPRNIMRASYWATSHTVPREREDVLVDEVLLSVTGDDGYPGDSVPSPHWPGVAPGTRGILNALSPKYCNWAAIVDLDPKPPVLWTHGGADVVISDASAWDMATLGAAGVVPGWPGPDMVPSQPMVTQIREVLSRYEAAGGRVRSEIFEGSGHAPFIDATQAWSAVWLDFLGGARPA